MALGTLSPTPQLTLFDSNGDPLSGGLLYVYSAGTSTPVNTYTTSALTTANAQPVVADSAGRVVVYLVPGQSYKYICKNSADVTQWTQDNIAATPTSAANQDVTGTAGEALSAGNVVYLSDGSGSLNAGQWYKADADQTYSSVTPILGMVPDAIASGSSGTIRTGGTVTGLSGLTVGTTYYVSATAGALTATAPSNSRIVGVAVGTDTIITIPNPPQNLTSILETQVFGG